MNSSLAAKLISEGLGAESDLSALTILPAGSESELTHPGAVVAVEDFEEHETLLGTHEGRVVVRLETIPADTTLSEHSDLAAAIRERLGCITTMSSYLASYFGADEIYSPQAPMTAADGLRTSEISVMAALVEKS